MAWLVSEWSTIDRYSKRHVYRYIDSEWIVCRVLCDLSILINYGTTYAIPIDLSVKQQITFFYGNERTQAKLLTERIPTRQVPFPKIGK